MLLCCMQSFLYLGQFLLASALLTPVLVMETDAWWEGQVITMLFLLSIDGQILHHAVLICIDLHGSIAAEQLNK